MTFGRDVVDLPAPNVRDMPALRLLPVALLAVALAGCSSGKGTVAATTPPSGGPSSAAPSGGPSAQQSPVAAENAPPGDIPDNLAYVRYTDAAGHYSLTHPEGWAQTGHGTTVLFTSKLDGVQIQPGTATTPPTVAGAKAQDVPALQGSQAAFELRSVTATTVPGGTGVLIVYRRNSAPDPVTGRQYRDEVQHYELVHAGREVVVELFGPVGADNVDAYRTMIQSLKIA